MDRIFLHYFAFLLATGVLSSCGKTVLGMFQAQSSNFIEDPNSPLADMATRCGASMSDLQDPDFVIVSSRFQSTVVADGTKDGVTYSVVTLVTSTITAKGGSSQVDVNVAIQSMSAKDSAGVVLTQASLDKVVKPAAENNTNANSGTMISTSAPGTQLMRLSRQDGPYKNMLCAVGFTAGQKDLTGGTTGEVRFEQPIPLSLNPKAAASTYENELGNGRQFQINATIVAAKPSWGQIGGTVPLQVNWQKVSPDIKQSSQIPGANIPAVQADVAYEVTVNAGAFQPYQIGLSKRRVFYVNSSTHQLVAIVDESGKPQIGSTDNKVNPPVILVTQ